MRHHPARAKHIAVQFVFVDFLRIKKRLLSFLHNRLHRLSADENTVTTFAKRMPTTGADAATITPQLSTDLTAWTGALVPLSNVVNPGGTRTIRLRSATAPGVKEFFRLHVAVP